MEKIRMWSNMVMYCLLYPPKRQKKLESDLFIWEKMKSI